MVRIGVETTCELLVLKVMTRRCWVLVLANDLRGAVWGRLRAGQTVWVDRWELELGRPL